MTENQLVPDIEENLERIRSCVAQAMKTARRGDSVRIMAVTKMISPYLLIE